MSGQKRNEDISKNFKGMPEDMDLGGSMSQKNFLDLFVFLGGDCLFFLGAITGTEN